MGACSSTRSASVDVDEVSATVEALETLQNTLHKLTPRQCSDVRRKLPFAASEWLEGLALSIRAQSEGPCASPEASKHSGHMVAIRLAQMETADAARIRLTPDTGKIVLILVGLPARGKSLICHRLEHFLAWRGYSTKSFKVGDRRRAAATNGNSYSGASFFDSSKAFAAATREQVSLEAFDELVAWLSADNGGQIAIFDASNVTIQRRAKLKEKAAKAKLGVVFIETICTDEDVIAREMRWKVRNSDDFKGMAEADALRDLQQRIVNYEKSYQSVREEEGPYIKMYDLRAKAHCCNVYGRMANKVLPFLLATHGIARPIFLCVLPTGNEADASQTYRDALAKWGARYEGRKELQILTSTDPRAIKTAAALADATGGPRPESRPNLAPLILQGRNSEADNGAAAAEAAGGKSFSATFGEKVSDLVMRLEPIVLELEGATQPVMVIAREAPCRTLRTYLRKGGVGLMSSRDVIDTSLEHRDATPTLYKFEARDSDTIEETQEPLINGESKWF